VSDEKLWDESFTSRHLQVLYHQTSFQMITSQYWIKPALWNSNSQLL